MQMTTSPITLHSAASPGGIRAASPVSPTENEGVAGLGLGLGLALALALVELGDVVLDSMYIVAMGSVPIIECVVPITIVDVVFEDFVSLVTIPPNIRLVVPASKLVSIVVTVFWAGRRASPPRSPSKSRGMYGVKVSIRGCECTTRI